MNFIAIIISLVVIAAIAGGIIWLVSRRRTEPQKGELDLIAYLLLAIAVGTTIFGLARLGRAAFPGEAIVLSAGAQVPAALAALIVGGPFAVFLWNRQAARRKIWPDSPGWALYLTVAEAVLMTTLVVVAFQLLDWLLGDGPRSSWTNVLIVGAAVAFHEWAARRDPPGSDVAGLPRVVGSAIGLITGSLGLAGLLYWILDYLYGTAVATAGTDDWRQPLFLLVLGTPLWAYRWLRSWPTPPQLPRKAWLVIATTSAAITALTSVVVIIIAAVNVLIGKEPQPLDVVPGAAAVLVVAGLIWWHHRPLLSPMWAVTVGEKMAGAVSLRENPLRSYEYLMAAAGLSVGIGSLTALTAIAFGRSDLVVNRASTLVSLGLVAAAAVVVWLWYWSKCQRADRPSEAVSIPRRVYLIGGSVMAGLTGAQALIATLVVLFQAAFGQTTSDTTLAVEGALTVFGTAATLHLLQQNRSDRSLQAAAEVVTPFSVTVVCSHPGPLATLFPKEATLRVIHRADEVGMITPEMAEEIVAAVSNRSSVVWVDETGFRVGPTL